MNSNQMLELTTLGVGITIYAQTSCRQLICWMLLVRICKMQKRVENWCKLVDMAG